MRKYKLSIGGNEYRAEVKELTADIARILVNDREYVVELKELERTDAPVRPRPAASAVPAPERPSPPEIRKTPVLNGDSGGVKAPLPGLIVDVLVREGDSVKAGQNVVLMEAMKMENQIQAPYDGSVKKLFVDKGDSVSEGDVLLELVRPPHTTL